MASLHLQPQSLIRSLPIWVTGIYTISWLIHTPLQHTQPSQVANPASMLTTAVLKICSSPSNFQLATPLLQVRRLALETLSLLAKYYFIHQQQGTYAGARLAFFPRIFVPTANPHFGTGRVGLLLPMWAEKDSGRWSIFGVGGYAINPGLQQRDDWQTGLAMQCAFDERLAPWLTCITKLRTWTAPSHFRA